MASLSPTSATTTCGACGAGCGGDHANQDPGDFCASCGHALVEDCFKCGHRVGLEQKFCGKCGVNLAQRVDRRRGEFEQQLTRAVAETKSHRFDDALDLLSRLTNEGDYRFADLRENAIQAAEKIRLLKSQTTDQVAKRIAAAAHADAQGLRNRVVEILSTVPEPMLDDPSRTRLQTAKAEMADIAHTRKTLTESLDAKKWRDAGLAIGRLLTLEPENDGVKKLARKISGRAVATADALVARGSIDRAIGYLESIPPACQNDDVDAMLKICVGWIGCPVNLKNKSLQLSRFANWRSVSFGNVPSIPSPNRSRRVCLDGPPRQTQPSSARRSISTTRPTDGNRSTAAELCRSPFPDRSTFPRSRSTNLRRVDARGVNLRRVNTRRVVCRWRAERRWRD